MPSIREATVADVPAIAELHADSWRRHYREAYPPEFFGPTLDVDRASTWSARLNQRAGAATLVAEVAGELVGFVHVVFGDDPRWGSLLDNLHVRHDMQRHGVGADLLSRAANCVRDDARGPMYLWVLAVNTRAQAFYQAMGGTEEHRRPASPPALPGIEKIRYVWRVGALSTLAAIDAST